jgi:hypothetical protein
MVWELWQTNNPPVERDHSNGQGDSSEILHMRFFIFLQFNLLVSNFLLRANRMVIFFDKSNPPWDLGRSKFDLASAPFITSAKVSLLMQREGLTPHT